MALFNVAMDYSISCNIKIAAFLDDKWYVCFTNVLHKDTGESLTG